MFAVSGPERAQPNKYLFVFKASETVVLCCIVFVSFASRAVLVDHVSLNAFHASRRVPCVCCVSKGTNLKIHAHAAHVFQ